MKIIKSAKEMQNIALKLRADNKIIGFVPTMGFLHDGHLSLVKKANTISDITVVSIFVNPTQFGPNEDLDSYPRDFKHDCELLKNLGVDYVYNPTIEEIYPKNYHTFVIVEELTKSLCGKSRPTHFRGVATIVTKLFNVVMPHYAVFGQKDIQQYYVIKRMTEDLNLLPKIVISPIIRENDGLAMSSRNKNLTADERKCAPAIFRTLTEAKKIIQNGERDANKIIEFINNTLSKYPLFKIDYIEIIDTNEFKKVDTISSDVIIATAIGMSKARLIDNVIVNL
jgi:pantoate--beta-alanine ligase